MHKLSVTLNRARHLGLSSPVRKSSLGLIVKDYRRDEFQSWDDIRFLGKAFRLGVEDPPGNIAYRQTFLKDATIVPLECMEQELELLA